MSTCVYVCVLVCWCVWGQFYILGMCVWVCLVVFLCSYLFACVSTCVCMCCWTLSGGCLLQVIHYFITFFSYYLRIEMPSVQKKSNCTLMFTLRSRGDIDESDNFIDTRSCRLALDSIAIKGLESHTLLSVLLLAAGVTQVH